MVDSSASPGSRELPHLATFARAAERGSFTDAAADLGVTQAAVSQRIAALEKELRVSLFNRRAGRIALTEAGERLYELAGESSTCTRKRGRASAASTRASRATCRLRQARSLPSATSRPCSPPSARSIPEVHVRASVSDSSSVMKEVTKGLATLGLVGQKAEKPSLESEAIGTDTLVLILAPGHPLAVRKSISLAVLAREPLIIREPVPAPAVPWRRASNGPGRRSTAMTIALEMGSNAAIKDAVRRGLGAVVCLPLDGRTELSRASWSRSGSVAWSLTRYFYAGLSPPPAALACGVGVPPFPRRRNPLGARYAVSVLISPGL